jgi:F0F1-type ATP synthase delta subunit
MAKLSRRKLAMNAASRLANGEPKDGVLRDVAAYLIESGRKREADLVVRDIEAMMLGEGTALATVTSARPLSTDSRRALESFVEQSGPAIERVILREQIDESLIGGVKLELPGSQLDTSVKAKLDKITA